MIGALRSRRSSWVLIGGVVLLAGAIVIGFVAVSAAPDTKVVQRATASANYYATERARFSNSPEKQAIVDKEATHVGGLVLTPPRPFPTRDPHATLAPLPTPVFLTGIFELSENPYRRSQPAANEWFGVLGGRSVAVYASYLYNDSMQGLVGVATGELDGTNAIYQEYLTPKKDGFVRITAVDGTRVTLTAKDGTVFVFDLAARTFV